MLLKIRCSLFIKILFVRLLLLYSVSNNVAVIYFLIAHLIVVAKIKIQAICCFSFWSLRCLLFELRAQH